jgi:hypothetical protein
MGVDVALIALAVRRMDVKISSTVLACVLLLDDVLNKPCVLLKREFARQCKLKLLRYAGFVRRSRFVLAAFNRVP